MKKILVLAFLLCTIISFGQGKKGGGVGSAAAASPASLSPSAGSGNSSLQTGFGYRLPVRYHIRYQSVNIKIDTVYTRVGINALPANPLIRMTAITNTRTITGKTKKDYDTVWVKKTILDTAICSSKPCVPEGFPGSTVQLIERITTTITTDTLERYLEIESRPKVTISQGDMGKLQVFFRSAQVPINQYRGGEGGPRNNFDVKTFTVDGLEHVAIPVDPMDSAQNLSLQIKNKVFISDPTYYISLPYSVVQYGPVSIPYKIRFANGRKTGGYAAKDGPFPVGADTLSATSDATTSFNLALYLGFKFGRTRFYYDQAKTHNTVSYMFSIFAGPQLIALSSSNVLFNTNLSKVPSNVLGLSYGMGLSVEWQSFSFGLFSGMDTPLQKNSPWVYKNKAWLGFGIGFNLGMLTSASAQK